MEASFYPYIIAFSWIGFFLLIGTFLRAKINFLQKMHFPASLIGGLIGFIAYNLDLVLVPTTLGLKNIDPQIFRVIVFHLFAFGFVAIGLLENQSNNSKPYSITQGALWFACLFTMLKCIQSLTGYSVFSLLNNYLGIEINPINGYLLGIKAAGQAQAYAMMWETSHQIAYAVSIGLGFAAIGYLIAALVGIPFISICYKKNFLCSNTTEISNEINNGIYSKESQKISAYSTTHASNIDSFSFHFAILLVIYAIAYLLACIWTIKMPKAYAPLGFGLLFIWTVLLAIRTKKVLKKFNLFHLIDQGSLKSFSGFTIDFTICAVFLSIEINDLSKVLLPFIIVSIINTALVLSICVYFARRTKEFAFERMVALFGTCTGSTSSGLLLLRIVDPKFKTPVALELGLMSAFTTLLNFPIAFASPFAPIEAFPYKYLLMIYIVLMPLYLLYKNNIQFKKIV